LYRASTHTFGMSAVVVVGPEFRVGRLPCQEVVGGCQSVGDRDDGLRVTAVPHHAPVAGGGPPGRVAGRGEGRFGKRGPQAAVAGASPSRPVPARALVTARAEPLTAPPYALAATGAFPTTSLLGVLDGNKGGVPEAPTSYFARTRECQSVSTIAAASAWRQQRRFHPAWVGAGAHVHFLGHRFAANLWAQGGPERDDRQAEGPDGRRRAEQQDARRGAEG